MFFLITTSQGRSDTFYLEATNKNKIISFLNYVSTAVIRNIKEVVYSKKYNINYVSSIPFVESTVYFKVILFAYSKTYSQQFTLYNVKKTITKEDLVNHYKKLLIVNEPILGFYDISFYKENSKNENIEFMYQVQYKRNSKTYVEDFYSESYDKVKDFFENVIDGELLEIRKYVHLDNTVIVDDGQYVKRMSFYITNDKFQFSSFVPKIKRNFKIEQIKESMLQNLDFRNQKIKIENVNLRFK